MRALVLILFFLSGAVGLAYEVAWTRALLLLLGSTAGASAVVLGVFVAGLGLGARAGGRRAEQSARPLKLYGWLELLAGLWALVTLLLLMFTAGPYSAIASSLPESLRFVLRLLVAAVIVFPTAFLLGGTLPAMVRHWVRTVDRTGRTTALLYGLNTIGAVAGCLWTGFFGVEQLGVSGVLLAAAAVGIGIGGLSLWIAARAPAAEAAARPQPRKPRPGAAWAAAMLCGFLGLGIEIAGFRILVFFLEGFTVTFAAMLGIFIAGLGLGSLALGDLLTRGRRPARVLGVLLVAEALVLGLALFVLLPGFEDMMREVKAGAYAHAGTEASITAALRHTSLLGAAFLLFVPAFLLGPTFSLCVRWAELDGHPPGDAVGLTYLGNSLGSLLAPLLLTFAVMPWAGVLGGWFMMSVLALCAGLGFIFIPAARIARMPVVLSVALGALLLGLLAPLGGIAGTRTEDLVGASVVLHGRPDRVLVDHATDNVTTASVIETDDGERILYTDAFPAAATGRYYRYMRMLGHLPALLAKDPSNAMVIAFGTGTTAGAVAAHAGVKRLEVVEVSGAVLELAHHFEVANRGVLNDPRVQVLRDDGRNALLLHAPDLDLITLEPLMPYSPAGLPFYTQEFYELARSRLRDGGVICQWIPVHAMRADLYAAFVRTFFEVFPDGTLWFFEQSTALIGRKGTQGPSAAQVRQRAAAIQSDLADAGFQTPMAFASGFLATGRDVLASPVPVGPAPTYARRLVRDGDPFPEFHPTPRARLNTPYLVHTLDWLESLVDPADVPTQAWWPANMDDRREGTRLALEARMHGAQAAYLGVFAGSAALTSAQRLKVVPEMLHHHDAAAVTYTNAIKYLPEDAVLRRRRLLNLRSSVLVRASALMHRAGQLPEREGVPHLRQADRLLQAVLPPIEIDPEPLATERERTANLRAAIQIRLGRCAAAANTLAAAARALAGHRAAIRLEALAASVRALIAGEDVREPQWLLAPGRRPACRAGGIAAVRAEWAGFFAAQQGRDIRRLRGAAMALVQAARTEDVILEVIAAAEALGEGDEARSMEARAAVAGLLLALAPTRVAGSGDPLLALLEAQPGAAVPVLLQIANHGWIDRYVRTPIIKLAEAAEPAVRRTFVEACGAMRDPGLVCLVVNALMDDNASVRKEAVGALFTRAGDELQEYDPDAPAKERQAAYDAVRRRLGCR